MSKVYDIVTDRIIEDLQEGVAPWECPWFGSLRNPVSDHAYRGVNRLLLGAEMLRNEYALPLFCTYRQAQKLGAHVKKGESSALVTFFKIVEKTPDESDELDEPETYPVLRYYRVFNIDQLDGVDVDALSVEDFDPLDEAERHEHADEFIDATGAQLQHSGNPRAYYAPTKDIIHLPHFRRFKHARGYYSTAIHELTHWTGHESRLARNLAGRFGDESYAAEELIAELGAAYTMARLGFAYDSQRASYIDSWISLLDNDKYAIFTASSAAEEAADYLADITGLDDDEEDDAKDVA